MHTAAEFLLTIGCILLLGLVTSTLGQRSLLPRVTLLLIFGALIGPELLDMVPHLFLGYFEVIADMALLMVGFLLGGRLTLDTLKQSVDKVFAISLSTALVTAITVSALLMLAGVTVEIAILLGCIASATAPAAVLDVTMESGGQSRFKDLLLSIVALDDLWALVLFAVGLAMVTSLNGGGIALDSLTLVIKDVGGAVMLGVIIGLPSAYLTGRVKPGQPILSEALGLVFVCGGLALYLEVSFLIASMTMGAVIANLAKHHEYPFHAIEGIEWPVMVIFFVLAGASLELTAVKGIGVIGVVYILARIAGKLVGAWYGGRLSHADRLTQRWMGPALLPQAGVAIGMALVAANQFPDYQQVLLTVVISSTVFFEIIGPVFTRMALTKTSIDS